LLECHASNLELQTDIENAEHAIADMETAHTVPMASGHLHMPRQRLHLTGLGQFDPTLVIRNPVKKVGY
jgi:hypothetical protein